MAKLILISLVSDYLIGYCFILISTLIQANKKVAKIKKESCVVGEGLARQGTLTGDLKEIHEFKIMQVGRKCIAKVHPELLLNVTPPHLYNNQHRSISLVI